MPRLASFDGIDIMFFQEDHPPPHFHAEYAEFEALIDIDTLEILVGELPRPQLRKVRAWAKPRKAALSLAWLICEADGDPGKIP